MGKSRKVIIVTDGDNFAGHAVEIAARNIGGRCISMSKGHPTPITGEQIVSLIKQADHDPVVVMMDDRGYIGEGKGERALEYISCQPDIEILGVLAVASNTEHTQGLPIQVSMDKNGELVHGPVDKCGIPEEPGHKYLEGDTIEVLNKLKIENIIGIGDIGKMDYHDDPEFGAPVTTAALREILHRSGWCAGD